MAATINEFSASLFVGNEMSTIKGDENTKQPVK